MSLRIELNFFPFFFWKSRIFCSSPLMQLLVVPTSLIPSPPFFTIWWKTIFWASPSGTFPTPLAVYEFSLSRVSLVLHAKISFGIKKNVVVNETSEARGHNWTRVEGVEFFSSSFHRRRCRRRTTTSTSENVSLYCSHVVDRGFLAPQRERLQDSSYSVLWFLRNRSLCFSRKIISPLSYESVSL